MRISDWSSDVCSSDLNAMVIVELAAEELCHGTLATVFANGAAAAVVRCNDEVRRLWAQLLENPQEQLPWEAPLIDIARNYHGHGDITASLGDVYYFQPGHHSYIRSEEHTSDLQSLMRISYAVFCL